MFYSKKDPFFAISPEEWQSVRGSTALGAAKDKIERKKKILHMMFKNAFMNVQENPDPFFKADIPEAFEEVKM